MTRSFGLWLVSASVARAPALMAPVAFTSATALAFDDANRGGLLASVFTLGLLVGTPLAIRAQSQMTSRRLLTWQLLAAAGLWVVLAWAIQAGWAWNAWLALVAAIGAVSAGTAGLIRSTMADAVDGRDVARASSLDSVSLDVMIFLAPLAVSLGVRLGPPSVVGVVALTACLAVAAVRPLHPRSQRAPSSECVRRSPEQLGWTVVIWSGFGLAVGAVLAAAEAGAVDLAHAVGLGYHNAYLALLVMSVASIIGGTLDALTTHRVAGTTRLAVYSALFVAGGLIVAARPGVPLVAVGLLLLGLPTAALLGIRSHRLDSFPPEQRAKTLSWAMAAQSIGFALGAAGLHWLGQPTVLVLGGIATAVAASVVWRELLRAEAPS